jgi:rare lipoprotein A
VVDGQKVTKNRSASQNIFVTFVIFFRNSSISLIDQRKKKELAAILFMFYRGRAMSQKNYFLMSIAAASVLLHSCASDASSQPSRQSSQEEWKVSTVQHGKASWYSVKTNSGTQTASGERLSNDAATAAHKTLPMGTRVRVTNMTNGKSEIVRITDRGPYTKGRIIDVTVGCAERLGFYSRGVVPVKVEVLDTKP